MRKKAVEAFNQAWPTFKGGVRAKVPPSIADGFEEKVTTLRSIAEAYDKRTAAADGSASLSETGRAKERAAAREDARPALAAFVDSTAGVLDKRREDALAALVARVAVKPPSDPAERIAFESWASRFLESLQPPLATRAERNHVLENAKDPRVIAAIENAGPVSERAAPGALPAVVPFVDPQVVAAARMARAKAAASPEAMTEMEAWEHLAGAYRALTGFVVSAMEEDTDAPTPPRFVDPRTGAPVPVPGDAA